MMIATRREPWKVFLSCTLAFSLTACSTARTPNVWHDLGAHPAGEAVKVSPPTQRWGAGAEGPEATDPQIAPGNLLAIRTPDDAKLNGDYRVDMDGTLQLPYNMTVNTSGLTASQLEKRLNELYRPYFKATPNVRVRLQERRYSVDIRGLVEKPGRYLVEQNASLDQVITQAGGFSKDNPPRFVRIQKGSKSMILDVNQYMNKGDDHAPIAAWMGGETISFQKDVLAPASASGGYRLPAYIMGEVRKPGEYTVRPGSDLLDLITQANGFTDAADLGMIEIIRRSGGRQLAYELPWKDISQAPAPMDGDVVFVHADHETRTERHVTMFVGILTAIATIVTAAVVADKL